MHRTLIIVNVACNLDLADYHPIVLPGHMARISQIYCTLDACLIPLRKFCVSCTVIVRLAATLASVALGMSRPSVGIESHILTRASDLFFPYQI